MNIETQIAKEDIGMLLTFWGTVVTFKELSSNKLFSKYIIKSKETPIIPDGWELGSYTFSEAKKVRVKKGESIDKVVDNLGNQYFEITSLI
jgi:hypothetical protein